MAIFNRLALAGLLLCASGVLTARTKKGDKLLAESRAAEARKDFDSALDLGEQALSEDPSDAAYQIVVTRVRFAASNLHVSRGYKLRQAGQVAEALAEFEKAFAINPASDVAEQEIRRTREILERQKRKEAAPGPKAEEKPDEKGLTASQLEKKQEEEKFASMLPVPELRPLNPQPINLKMNNQPPKVLFETVGKLAGINVLFDPEYAQGGAAQHNQSIEFTNSTLDEALDYLGVVTKSFWKPLSTNTIFISQDNPTKRRDYEEQVVKVFYLQNVVAPQEIQEIVTALRTVAEIQKVFTYNAQNAIVARAESDKIALAEKIVADLDKPRSEVLVDVLVAETSRSRSRNLAAAIAPKGINSPITFTPRTTIQTPSTGSGTGTGTGTGAAAAASNLIPISNIGRVGTGDFSVTLPGGLIEALMSDSNTRVLQSPQVRAADGQKASLKIGQKVPIATGSFQPGIGGVGVGISPLVNTQFTYQDVGVNVDITPKIHGAEEVSLHIEVEISSVVDRVDLGGISQPIIGQRKVIHDIRIRQGEVNLIGGLMQHQETRSVSGVPGLSAIPVLGNLFKSRTLEKSDSELVIALVPHIVRAQDLTGVNLRGIAAGNATTVKLNYAPRTPPPGEPPKGGVVTTPSSSTPAPRTAPPPPSPAAPPANPPATATPQQPPPSARAAFAPPQVSVAVNTPITVALIVDGATDLFAASVRIKFDPSFLRLNDVLPGNALLAGNQQPPVFSKNILNDSGDGAISMSLQQGGAGAAGSGALVTMMFTAVGPGSTTVSVAELALANSQGQPIPAPPPVLAVTVK